VIQPVVVREIEAGHYELIVGERRWRAAQMAGLLKVPAIVRDVSDDQLLELALIENIQREELNPLETALAYQNLIDHLGLTQGDVADRVGKQRSTVTNMLRLLNLPSKVQDRVRSGAISLGHAKALASLSSPRLQVDLAEKIVRGGISVRQAEQIVGQVQRAGGTTKLRQPEVRDPNVVAAEESLQRELGTRVKILQDAKGRGRIELHFFSEEELQRVYEVVMAGIRPK
jgi:ParB family chromosome partitioning protein